MIGINENSIRAVLIFLLSILMPSIVLAQTQPTIKISGTLTYTYNGISQGTFTSTVVGSSALVTYTYKGVGTSSSNYGPTTSKPKNAGLYQVVATVAADISHNTLSASSTPLNFTILQAPSSIIIKYTSGGYFTYNGKPQGPDSLIVTGSTGQRVINYRGIRSTIFGPGTIKPTNIGFYYANATLYADTNYLDTTSKGVEFAIKGNSTVTLTGPVTYTYDGTRQGPNTAKVIGSSYPATYVYSGTGSTTYNSSSLAPIKAGTFQVVAAVTYDSLYNAAISVPQAFTINQAASTITVTGNNLYTYNTFAQGPITSTILGSTGLVSFTYSGTGSTTYTSTTSRPIYAGAYQTIANLASSANYLSASSIPFNFTIAKAATKITITGDTLYTYDGKEQGKFVTNIMGSSASPTFSYSGVDTTIYGPSIDKPIKTGSYQLIAKVSADVNYFAANSVAFKFKINPAPFIDTTKKDTVIVIIPKPDTPVIIPSKLDTLKIVPVIKDTTILIPIIDTTIADSTFKDSTIIATNKIFASTILIEGFKDYEYNGNSQGPNTSLVTGTTALPKYFYSGRGATVYGPTMVVPKNAGTYQVFAKVAADANSDSAISEVVDFEIKKVVLTITAQNAFRCYQLVNPVFNYRIEGYVSNDDSTAISVFPEVYTLASIDSTAGNYKLKLTEAVALNYSFNYVDGILTIYPLPIANITSAVNYVCDGATLALQTSAGYAYVWYKNQEIINNQSDLILNVSSFGEYSCKLTSKYGCKAMATNTLSIKQFYAPTANFSTLYSCIHLPVFMNNTSEVNISGPVKYDWNSGAGESSNILNPNFVYNSIGNKKISLTITPIYCPALQNSISKNVLIELPIPAIKMPTSDVVVFMPLKVEARNFGVKYNWVASKISTLGNVALVMDSSNPKAVIITNTDAMLSVKITESNSCFTTDSMQVRVFKNNNVYLPNSFSPNGDGINDVFAINPVGIFSLGYFRIYDNWGGLVFETNNLSQGWDGKLNGVRLPMATYTWMIQATDIYNNSIKEMGSVTLIR